MEVSAGPQRSRDSVGVGGRSVAGQSRASDSPSPGQVQGEPHAGERRYMEVPAGPPAKQERRSVSSRTARARRRILGRGRSGIDSEMAETASRLLLVGVHMPISTTAGTMAGVLRSRSRYPRAVRVGQCASNMWSGEKLMTFSQMAETDEEFRAELPAFCERIRWSLYPYGDSGVFRVGGAGVGNRWRIYWRRRQRKRLKSFEIDLAEEQRDRERRSWVKAMVVADGVVGPIDW